MSAAELAKLLESQRMPSTLLGALRAQVENCAGRLESYEHHSPGTRWTARVRAELLEARRELALFEAGKRPRALPGAEFHETRLGPEGRRLCRWCDQECAKKQQTFCSPACVREWRLRSQPGFARAEVWKRDAGRCALCPEVCGQDGPWEADHIIPVAEGGGCCGLENLRTLCGECHKGATAALRKRLAARKKDSPRLGAD
jgi:5-methylcytosine-specific restriction endonuclease McrA